MLLPYYLSINCTWPCFGWVHFPQLQIDDFPHISYAEGTRTKVTVLCRKGPSGHMLLLASTKGIRQWPNYTKRSVCSFWYLTLEETHLLGALVFVALVLPNRSWHHRDHHSNLKSGSMAPPIIQLALQLYPLLLSRLSRCDGLPPCCIQSLALACEQGLILNWANRPEHTFLESSWMCQYYLLNHSA